MYLFSSGITIAMYLTFFFFLKMTNLKDYSWSLDTSVSNQNS